VVLPKNSGNLKRAPNRLSIALPPLDVASSMLCESVCHQLWSWEEALLSSVSFCEVMFQWPGDFFKLIWPILSSKESASNFVLIFIKLLRKPTVSYRKPSEIMPWAKANFFMVLTLQGQTKVCRRRWAYWTSFDKHNTGKRSKRSPAFPYRW